MKQLLYSLAMASVILMPTTSYAGGNTLHKLAEMVQQTTPEQRATHHTNQMLAMLKLDGNQTAKVKGINLRYAREIETIVASDTRKLKKLRQLRKLRSRKDSALKTALTEEQFALYQEKREEMRARMGAI